MPAFHELLLSAMRSAGINQATLSRSLKYKSQAFVSDVARDQKALPLDQIEPWADALELTGLRRTEFIRAAVRQFAPRAVAQLVTDLERLEGQLEECRRGLG